MLERHSQKVFRAALQTMLYINQDTLWANALAFYKAALHDLGKIKKRLAIVFENEPGVDVGSVTAEFVDLLLREIISRLFEGDEK